MFSYAWRVNKTYCKRKKFQTENPTFILGIWNFFQQLGSNLQISAFIIKSDNLRTENGNILNDFLVVLARLDDLKDEDRIGPGAR